MGILGVLILLIISTIIIVNLFTNPDKILNSFDKLGFPAKNSSLYDRETRIKTYKISFIIFIIFLFFLLIKGILAIK